MSAPFPLDLERTPYAYVERPNSTIQRLLNRWIVRDEPTARILDIGCGCGANAQALRERAPGVRIVGIEPNARAVELAKKACDEVFHGTSDEWLATEPSEKFDAVVLSDVVEHIADPLAFLRSLANAAPLAGATFIVSVPNYAVWYNRLRTLAGRFDYAFSGLYDRTHLRFFTRESIRKLLSQAGFEVIDDGCTPSLLQSTAPLLRRLFERDVAEGNHLALADSGSYRLYRQFVEPAESAVCHAWPELLGFQVVTVARPKNKTG